MARINNQALAARREREAKLYSEGLTPAAIADREGISVDLVRHDLRLMGVKMRPRGGAIAEGVRKFWDSEKGQAQKRRRSEALRQAPPVQRVCEWCGEPFELSAKRARQEPGRFCSRECALASKRRDAGPELEKLREGRVQWRARVADFKATSGLLDLDAVRQALPREIRRSQAALSGHIADGGLVPTPNEFGLLLFTDTAIQNYMTGCVNTRTAGSGASTPQGGSRPGSAPAGGERNATKAKRSSDGSRGL